MDLEPSVVDLVRRAGAGEAQAWEALVERYSPLVLSVVRGYRLGEDDVHDIVQTVWLRLVESLDKLREPRALPGWLITTSRNETLRTLKGQARTRPVAFALDSDPLLSVDDHSIDEDLLRIERREAVLEAFAELNDRDRALLTLLSADPAVPYVEISRRLGMSIGSIGPTRARILGRLRACPAVAGLLMAADAAERTQR